MVCRQWVMVMVIGVLGAVAGCAQTVVTPTAPPIGQRLDAQQVAALQQQYRAGTPDLILGQVVGVDPTHHLAAVGDVPVDQFKSGDAVSFTDQSNTFLTNGIVVNVTRDAVHVDYEQPGMGKRAPAVGDLVFRFQK